MKKKNSLRALCSGLALPLPTFLSGSSIWPCLRLARDFDFGSVKVGVARLVHHVSELVIQMERVDRRHEAATAGSRDCHCFFAHAPREVLRHRMCEKSLISVVSRARSAAQRLSRYASMIGPAK